MLFSFSLLQDVVRTVLIILGATATVGGIETKKLDWYRCYTKPPLVGVMA